MNKLKNLRKLKGFTQKYVAENSGISIRTYSRYESEKEKRMPEIKAAIRIANTLDVTNLRDIWSVD